MEKKNKQINSGRHFFKMPFCSKKLNIIRTRLNEMNFREIFGENYVQDIYRLVSFSIFLHIFTFKKHI